jgi:hypothetical protein
MTIAYEVSAKFIHFQYSTLQQNLTTKQISAKHYKNSLRLPTAHCLLPSHNDNFITSKKDV